MTGLTLAGLVLVSGCGPHQSADEPAPYVSSAPTKAAQLRTSFPDEKLRFTLPPMANDQEVAARIFIDFQRAYLTALRRHRINDTLRQTTQPTLLTQIRKTLKLGHGVKVPTTRTVVQVSEIVTAAAGVGILACVVTSGKHKPVAALMTGVDKGDLRVSAYLPDPKRKTC
jgi:hypothetical protein